MKPNTVTQLTFKFQEFQCYLNWLHMVEREGNILTEEYNILLALVNHWSFKGTVIINVHSTVLWPLMLVIHLQQHAQEYDYMKLNIKIYT